MICAVCYSWGSLLSLPMMLEESGQKDFVESGKEFCVQTDMIEANKWLEWDGQELIRSPVSFSDAVSGPGSHDDTARLGADWGVLVSCPWKDWSMGCGAHSQLALEGI